MTLAAWLMLKNRDLITVIIAPPKALMSFEKELTEKLKISYSVISTEKTFKNKNGRILLISNTCLEKAVPTLGELYKKYKILGIVDESHNGLQNRSSAMYKQFVQIRKIFCVLYFLTATSCKNNIEGMYWMISLLNPSLLGSWTNFRYNYLILNRKQITQTTKKGAK